MKKSRCTPEQVAFGLHQAEDGTLVAEVCCKMGRVAQVVGVGPLAGGVPGMPPDRRALASGTRWSMSSLVGSVTMVPVKGASHCPEATLH